MINIFLLAVFLCLINTFFLVPKLFLLINILILTICQVIIFFDRVSLSNNICFIHNDFMGFFHLWLTVFASSIAEIVLWIGM